MADLLLRWRLDGTAASRRAASLAALYLTGSPFAQNDPRALNVGGSLLSRAILQVSAMTEAALREAYRRHGDLGAAAGDVLGSVAGSSPLALSDIEDAFARIASARRPAQKLAIIQSLLQRTCGGAINLEAKYLVKIMLGDMRTGVKQAQVEEAIAEASRASLPDIRAAETLTGSLFDVAEMAWTGCLHEARMRLFHPLGFMLASPAASVEEALARFRIIPGHVDSRFEADPGSITGFHVQVEDKYDGIRAQLHCGDRAYPGRVAIYSRTREDMTASFPELAEYFSLIHRPLIFDGEILAWDPVERRALPFSSLQKRIGRKRVTQSMRTKIPVIFLAFDLLFAGEHLLLESPLCHRRDLLEQVVSTETLHLQQQLLLPNPHPLDEPQGLLFGPTPAEDSVELLPRLRLAPVGTAQSVEELEAAFLAARARGNEGLMLKTPASLYQPGRRGLAWIKLKRELATLDVVVTAAEYGNGRRAAVLSDYTFAVRQGDQLRNVGKAYSGLTDAEIRQLTAWFLDHVLEDHGDLLVVDPQIVLEVACNNVTRSDRHDSGFALRFPRILRIRTDKPVTEIDTVERVEEIYHSQPDKPLH